MGDPEDGIKNGGTPEGPENVSVQKTDHAFDDSDKGPVSPRQTPAPGEGLTVKEETNPLPRSGTDTKDTNGHEVQATFKKVPIFYDYHEDNYLEVLRSYEEYMLEYEALAPGWKEHYANVQQTIDLALGLSPGSKENEVIEITPEERERLKQIGHIVLFGCGFNPTRELSPKLREALKLGIIDLSLVDFSRKSLRSSILFFDNLGIKPKAAYQTDLTMGAAAEINTFMGKEKKWMKISREGFKLDTYIDHVGTEVDNIIQAFETAGPTAGFLNNYPMNDEDRPGLAISSMVTAATFLTVYGNLLNIINDDTGISSGEKELLIAKIRVIHAKFNAFVLRLNAAKMAELCKDKASVLIITDVNKVNLPAETPSEGQNHNIDDSHAEATTENIMAAVKAKVTGVGIADPALVQRVKNEARMSRNGKEEESLQDIIRSVDSLGYLDFDTMGEEDLRQWMWWDNPGNEIDGPGHGHKVQAINFKQDKKRKETVIGLLQSLPSEVIANGDPITAARLIKKVLNSRTEQEQRGFSSRTCLRWLKELDVPPPVSVPDNVIERHRPYMHKAAMEIIHNVYPNIIKQGWEPVLNYLKEKKGWIVDDRTMCHVITGMNWLRRFVEELKTEEI